MDRGRRRPQRSFRRRRARVRARPAHPRLENTNMPAKKKTASRPRRAKKETSRARRVKPTPEHAAVVYKRLVEHYPDAHTALDFTNPFELLVATILSAQSTDKRVNMVTAALFKRYTTPAELADEHPEDVEALI